MYIDLYQMFSKNKDADKENINDDIIFEIELIKGFIARVSVSTKVDDDWQKFVLEQKEVDFAALIEEEKLKPEETRRFVENAFRDSTLQTTGTDIDKILPPVSRFSGGSNSRAAKKQSVIGKLTAFFEKYLGLV